MLPLKPRLIFWPSGLCRNSLLHVQGMLWPGLIPGLPDTLDYTVYFMLYLHKESCIKSWWIMDFLGCSLHPLVVWQPKTCKSRDIAVAHKQINNVFTMKLPSMHNEVQLTNMHKCNSSENIPDFHKQNVPALPNVQPCFCKSKYLTMGCWFINRGVYFSIAGMCCRFIKHLRPCG